MPLKFHHFIQMNVPDKLFGLGCLSNPDKKLKPSGEF